MARRLKHELYKMYEESAVTRFVRLIWAGYVARMQQESEPVMKITIGNDTGKQRERCRHKLRWMI